MCSCESHKIVDGPTKICTTCGGVEDALVNRDYHSCRDALQQCVYSRSKRFENLLDSVLYPVFSNKDTQMYKLLEQKRFATVPDLVAFMRATSLLDKRFNSIHTFTTLVVDDYTALPPPSLEYKRRVLRLFDEILCRYRSSHSQFFSYPWLLNKLLTLTGRTEYSPFIKKIRCKKRREKYETLLQDLFIGASNRYIVPTILGAR